MAQLFLGIKYKKNAETVERKPEDLNFIKHDDFQLPLVVLAVKNCDKQSDLLRRQESPSQATIYIICLARIVLTRLLDNVR